MKTRRFTLCILIAGLAVALILLLGPSGSGLPVARAASYTVCPAGPPACDYSVIQDAVDAARNGDLIKVAAGTYDQVNNYYGLAQVVYLAKSLTIRGGYASAFAEPPDPVANPTTLDAGGRGRVIYIQGPISPTIEGLRITGGYTSGDGGGVYIGSATATLSNNQVFNNTAHNGGGLLLSDSDATLIDNTIADNTVDRAGGGLALGGSAATLIGNTISGNSADWGGGLDLWNSPATLSGNTISGNTATWGGGLFLGEGDGSATLSDNTVTSNTADNDGGGLFLGGSAATLDGNTFSANSAGSLGGGLYLGECDADLSGNTISNNSARWGGGLYVEKCDATLSGNSVSSNTAVWTGGGLSLSQSPATLTGNSISGNSAGDVGGVRLDDQAELINNLIVDNQATRCCGSGVSVAPSASVRMVHNTIARNTGGGGIGVALDEMNTVSMTNTILVGHTVGIRVDSGSTATLESTLWGNERDWEVEGTLIRTNDQWGDPDFIDADNGDYHIGGSSAALDAGVDAGVTTDIDRHPRPYLAPDLGADEYWPPGTLTFIHLPLVILSRNTASPYDDDFSCTTLDPKWHWVREDPTHWSLTEAPGYLRIVTQQKDIWRYNNSAPLLLQTFSADSFEIRTKIVMWPLDDYHQGGLVIYEDDDNYVRLNFVHNNGLRFALAQEIDAEYQTVLAPAPYGNSFHLRLRKEGQDYTGYYSEDGKDWVYVGQHSSVDITPSEIGLSAFNAEWVTPIEIPADFDYFQVVTD